MPLKESLVTGNLAISPGDQNPTYFVIGTAAQQIDASCDSSSKLSLFQLDLSSNKIDVPLLTSVQGTTRYSKLLWDGPSLTENGLLGIIAAGSEKGELILYDPTRLSKCGQHSGAQDSSILVNSQTHHTGPVMALDFNKFQPNLLASGASESDIYIWDLNKMDSPMTPGAKSQPLDDVLDLAWNYKVQHILASTFHNGCIIWDLRKSDPIIKLNDRAMKMHSRCARWHPSIATRLCIASDEDKTPWLQLWDLRFANAPVQTLENAESRGITDLDWNPHDSGVLLSSARDGVVRAWNVEENSTDTNWLYHYSLAHECPQGGLHTVKWCAAQPGLYAAASFESGVHFVSVLGAANPPKRKSGQRRQQTRSSLIEDAFGVTAAMENNKLAPEEDEVLVTTEGVFCDPVIKTAPKWMRRPCGATFGFGGRLVRFSVKEPGQVTCYQVVSDAPFVERCDRMKQWLSSPSSKPQDTSVPAMHLCQTKLAELEDLSCHEGSSVPVEKSAWQFIQAHLHPHDARSEFLNLLQVDTHSVEEFIRAQWKAGNCGESLFSHVLQDNAVSDMAHELAAQHIGTAKDDVDFFEHVPSQAPPDVKAIVNGVSSKRFSVFDIQEPLQLHSLPKDTVEGMLCEALLRGKLLEAIDLCFMDGREGQALILAVSSGDTSLYEKVKRRVLSCSPEKLSQRLSNCLISVSVDGDWEKVVQLCDIRGWREMLACLLTYTQGEKFSQLCKLLASRLEESGESQLMRDACLIYICCGDIENLARCWIHNLPVQSPHDLQSVMEVLLGVQLCVGAATAHKVSGDTVRQLYHRYASVLVNEGRLLTALRYLSNIAASQTNATSQVSSQRSLLMLLDRVYYGMNTAIPKEAIPHPPSKPFDVYRVSGRNAHQAHNSTSAASMGPNFAMRPLNQATNLPPTGSMSAYTPSAQVAPFQPAHVPAFAPAPRPVYQPCGPANTFTPIRAPPAPGMAMQPPTAMVNAPQMHMGSASSFSYNPGMTAFTAPSHAAPPRPSLPSGPPVGPPMMSGHSVQRSRTDSSSTAGGYPGTRTPDPFSHSYQAAAQPNMLPAAQRSDMGGWNDPPVLPDEKYENSVKPATPTPVNTFYNPAAFVQAAPAPNYAPISGHGAYGAVPGHSHPGHYPPSGHLPPTALHSSFAPSPATATFTRPPAPAAAAYPTQQQPPQSNSMLSQFPPPQPVSNGLAMFNAPPQQVKLDSVPPQATSHAPLAAEQPKQAPPPVDIKAGLSPEHEALKSTFSGLCEECKSQASNRQTKLKLEDVERRLDNLYDLLRSNSISPSVIDGLKQISSAVDQRDYNSALVHINSVIQTANFAEIRTFMPAIKVLMQTAAQLKM